MRAWNYDLLYDPVAGQANVSHRSLITSCRQSKDFLYVAGLLIAQAAVFQALFHEDDVLRKWKIPCLVVASTIKV
jgi:hypothetical protein